MGVEQIDSYEDAPKYSPVVYLLDTSTLLWSIMEPNRLSEAAKAIWQDPRKLIAVSVVSFWENVIKAKKKIFQLDDVGEWWDLRVLPYADLETLPIREEHIRDLLPLPDIHKDPFDRMLIAQARTEDMRLVTSDAHIRVSCSSRVVRNSRALKPSACRISSPPLQTGRARWPCRLRMRICSSFGW